MSSCFNGDWHARQLRWTVVMLAMLACGQAHAQSVDSQPFVNEVVSQPITDSVVSNRTTNGGTPLRLWHRTEGYGLEASETAIGGRGAFDLGGAVAFTDGQFRISNESRFGANVGGGVRWYGSDFLVGQPRIFGVSGWYDGQETVLNNYFNQGGVSFESLGEYIDFRLNANIPFEDEKAGDMMFITGDLNFSGNSLAQATIIPTDVALRVVDFEVAPRVFDLNLWVYGGGYQMDGNGISEMGAKVGFRGYLTNDLAVDVGVTDDEEFHTNTMFQVIWTPGRTGAGPTSWIHNLADRMREPVYRNTYIATQRVDVEGSMALTDAAGDELNIIHVDSEAALGGDGTFESPFKTLAEVNNASEVGDIILAHHDSTFDNEQIVLKDAQRFLGEGDRDGDGIREQHLITTSQLGTIAIPATDALADMGAIPIIQNAATSAVVLAGGNDEVESLAEIEVSVFQITGGVNAITSPTGVGDVNINRLDIANATGNAIELTPLTETLANNTMRSRFTPTIDDVTFTDIGGNDIDIDATTAQTTLVETVTISDIESDNGDGIGINLVGLNRAATISNFNWDGDNTSVAGSGIGALRIANSGGQGNVTLNGTNTITGGIEGTPNTQGYAFFLENNAGDLIATGTTITNMGGDTVIVEGGAGDLNFTGRVVQTENAASVLSVTDGHTGTLTFTELAANQGVIQATIGDGIQFDNADGTYTFNDEVELIGTSQAVNALGGDGAITFTNADFQNTTAETLTFNGGEMSMTLTGRVEQNNAFAVLSVTNGHDGTLDFNELTSGAGVIEANSGPGLVFVNADGAYTFDHEVDLSGGDAHIDISTGSDGTFTFADGNIVNPTTSSAVRIDGSNVIFTYTGNIDATNNDAVVLNANTGGSVTFTSGTTIDSTFGIDVTGNSGGTFLFAGAVNLTGGAAGSVNDGVFINNNAGGSTTFNNIDINRQNAGAGTGRGFVATNSTAHTVTVTGTGNTIATDDGTALQLENVTIGGSGVNFQSVSSTGANNGIILTNLTGGPVNIGASGAAVGTSGTIANSTGAGVVINNAANVTVTGLNVTTAGGAGFDIDHTNAAQSQVRIHNADISGTGGAGIDFNRSASALSRFTLTGSEIDTTGDDSVLMNVSGSDRTDITISGSNEITNTSGDSAVSLTATGAFKDMRVLITNNTVANNSTDATISLTNNSTGTLNTTVTNNTMNNSDPATGQAYSQTAAAGTTRLNFNGNTATNTAATDEVLLTQAGGGTFTVEDLADIETLNNGAQVQQAGTITDDAAGNIPQPTP